MALSRRRRAPKPLTNESVKEWLMLPIYIATSVCKDARVKSFSYIPWIKVYHVVRGLDIEYSSTSVDDALDIYNKLK